MPPPDWHDDVSVFHRPALNALVGYIDEQLKVTPSIADMALLVGMSPSHFTKKFRQSTELSVQRFVNRRRIRKSLDSPRNTSGTLAGITVDLGFSPQSHFTRFFGGLTGITPAKYRKQLRRPLG